MVAEILGVVNVFPVPNDVPPVAAVYQFIVAPVLGVAPKLKVPVPQRDAGWGLVTVGGTHAHVKPVLKVLTH